LKINVVGVREQVNVNAIAVDCSITLPSIKRSQSWQKSMMISTYFRLPFISGPKRALPAAGQRTLVPAAL
jgi:hypothetical protein